MEPYYTFHHELQNLNKKIMQVATLVEERLRAATNAITTRDEKEIQRIILTDYEIDDLEVEIEEANFARSLELSTKSPLTRSKVDCKV